jgi:exoribonuclease R
MDGPTGSAQYSTVAGEHSGLGVQHYVHITSPIRRIADIVNQAALMKDVMGYTVSADCERFLEKWLGKIDDLNAAMRNIRRVQMDCELLYHCRRDETAVDSIYSGMAIAKESDCEYTIYIEKLGLITYIKTETPITLFEPMRFQIYVFNDEARLYKKVRIRCV